HSRATDVDFFNDGLLVRFGGEGLDEGVQVGHYQVEGLDILLIQHGLVRWAVLVCQNACVDAWVQRLDPAVEDLWETGDLFHRSYRHSCFSDVGGGGSGGDNLSSRIVQTP